MMSREDKDFYSCLLIAAIFCICLFFIAAYQVKKVDNTFKQEAKDAVAWAKRFYGQPNKPK